MSTDDPHVLQPGHAPTPFTADEIRLGCPPGRTIRMRSEPSNAVPTIRVTRFRDATEDGAELETGRFTLDGESLDPPTRDRTRWAEFQAHASFPAEQTVVERDTIDTPIGAKECLRYTVGDAAAAVVFWFAIDLPGMPVRVEERSDDRVVFTMTMIDDTITPMEEEPWPT